MCCLIQPCGHSGICSKCVHEVLLCPICCDIISSCKTLIIGVPHLKPIGLTQSFSSTITPHLEHKNFTCKKVIHTTISLGMEISGCKEVNFNFDSNETFSDDGSLQFESLGCHKCKPRVASCMASNILQTTSP